MSHLKAEKVSKINGLRSKRILIISDRIAPFYVGGYETLLRKYIQILKKEYSITLATSYNDKNKFNYDSLSEQDINLLDGVNLVGFSKLASHTSKNGDHAILSILFYIIELRKHKKALTNFDLVILNSIPYFGNASLLKYFYKLNIKTVVLFHEAWYNYPVGFFNVFKKYIIRFTLKNIINNQKIIAVSKPTVKSLIENYSANPLNVKLVPIGIDPDERIGLSVIERPIDIIFIGRIVQIKHIRDILDVVYLISKRGIDINAVIAGKGPFLGSLMEYTKSKGLNNLVKFPGYVSEEEKKNLLSKSKIFVMPSEREGFSIITLEAMSQGAIPIVAKPKEEELFGISQYLVKDINGLYYNFGNLNEMVNQIMDVLQNPSKYEEMRKKAELTAKSYAWNEIEPILLNTIKNLLA